MCDSYRFPAILSITHVVCADITVKSIPGLPGTYILVDMQWYTFSTYIAYTPTFRWHYVSSNKFVVVFTQVYT